MVDVMIFIYRVTFFLPIALSQSESNVLHYFFLSSQGTKKKQYLLKTRFSYKRFKIGPHIGITKTMYQFLGCKQGPRPIPTVLFSN